MAFIRIPGKPGRFFVSSGLPESARKYTCVSCRQCHWCSDERCRVCRVDGGKRNGAPERIAGETAT